MINGPFEQTDFNYYNTRMFKPSLKRNQIAQNPIATITATSPQKNNQPTKKRQNLQSLMIPSRLLELPPPRSKDKTHLVTPLLVLPHTYPPNVQLALQSVEKLKIQGNRGVGAYAEINYIYIERKTLLWVVGDIRSEQTVMESQIISMAVTQLRANCLSSRIRHGYVVAIACQNYVSLYCLDRFSLKLSHSGLRYVMDYSLMIQSVKFLGEDQLLIASDGNCLQHIHFGLEQRIRRAQVPLYRKLLPITLLSASHQEVAQMLMTKDRIYLLVRETKPKGWIRTKIDELIDDNAQPTIRTTYVQIYQHDAATISQLGRITEKEVTQRLKNHYNEWPGNLELLSIYLAGSTGNEQELGIVTTCGWFLTLRNVQRVYFSREPVLAPTSAQFGDMRLIGERKFETRTEGREYQNRQHQVFCSLGYQDLTLTNNALIWTGDDRIDGVRSEQLNGDLCLRLSDCTQSKPFRQKEWAIFTFNSYFTIRQLPLRHLLVACFHYHYLFSEDQKMLNQETAFKKYIESLTKVVTPALMLRTFIEILISPEKSITVNTIVLQMIGRQLRGQKTKDFRDLQHELKQDAPRLQIPINDLILSKVWNAVFDLQYREAPPPKSNNPIDSNVYWLALHQLFHDIVQPLLPLTPKQFKQQRTSIENIHLTLLSLKSFLSLKHKYEDAARKLWLNKLARKAPTDQTEPLDTTRTETDHTDIAWMEESVSENISHQTSNAITTQLQQLLRNTVVTTSQLINIFFTLAEQEPMLNFRELISSTHHQNIVKTILLKREHFHSLVKIDEELPQLGLSKDLNFIRWANRQKGDQITPDSIDLKQLASVVTADHFEQTLEALKGRFDLHLQALTLYEDQLLDKKQSIMKQNTLQERSFLNNSLFPEDQLTLLKIKRQFLDSELSKTMEEEKRTLTKTAQQFAKAEPVRLAQYGRILDRVMLIVSVKPSLYAHFEDALRTAQIGHKCQQFIQLKPKQLTNHFCQIPNQRHKIPFQRQLFPRPPLP